MFFIPVVGGRDLGDGFSTNTQYRKIKPDTTIKSLGMNCLLRNRSMIIDLIEGQVKDLIDLLVVN